MVRARGLFCRLLKALSFETFFSVVRGKIGMEDPVEI
jgi:hypothetical protein